MKRLTVDLNDLARLRNYFQDNRFSPAQFAVLCEYAGAHGLLVSLLPGGDGMALKDVELIKALARGFLNVHLPLNAEHCKLALNLKPDMVTFVHAPKGKSTPLPMEPEFVLTDLPDVLPNFQASGISVAVFISPSIATLKELSKMAIDYVELDCQSVTGAADTNEQLVAVDNLRSTVFAAAKLGLGVNLFGDIDYLHLPLLAAIPQVEDITLGRSLLRRSLMVGVERAVREALDVLNHTRT